MRDVVHIKIDNKVEKICIGTKNTKISPSLDLKTSMPLNPWIIIREEANSYGQKETLSLKLTDQNMFEYEDDLSFGERPYLTRSRSCSVAEMSVQSSHGSHKYL